jgi:hypothetical protein
MPIQGVAPRLLEIGRIRMGEKGSKGEPKRLEHWRLTSAHLDSLNAAAKLWGGVVGEWEGGYELLTETDTLEVLVPPNAFTSYMEAWTAGGIQRRCDGLTELTTGDECLCNADGDQICEPSTNLRVLLPQLPGIGSWRLSTKGWTAAAELQGTIELLQKTAHRSEWPAAELFLDQRSKVVAGQTRRFIVPVLRLPYSLADLGASETRSLGSGVVVRVDTITGEINPLESPSRETPAGVPSLSAAGEQSAPIRGRSAGAEAGGRVETSSSASRKSSGEGTTTAADEQGHRGTTADPSSDRVPPAAGPRREAKSPSRGVATKGEGDTASAGAMPNAQRHEQPSPAGGRKTYPLAVKDCLHTVGVDVEGRCTDCGALIAEAAS